MSKKHIFSVVLYVLGTLALGWALWRFNQPEAGNVKSLVLFLPPFIPFVIGRFVEGGLLSSIPFVSQIDPITSISLLFLFALTFFGLCTIWFGKDKAGEGIVFQLCPALLMAIGSFEAGISRGKNKA
jgi:hypothetical protein